MTTVQLPALDGRVPLGFLAACGMLRLLDAAGNQGEKRPRLAWDPMVGTALLSSEHDLDGVVATLQGMAARIAEGALLPSGPPGFPGSTAPSDWPRGDPIRMPVCKFSDEVKAWRERYGREFIDQWLPAMVTDLAVDDQQCVELSPFAAPSGQQKFATMFEKTLACIREKPDLLKEALLSWRRLDGVTGEYLDHHVLRSAADRAEGESKEVGVPGATWLALMALPWFPVWSDGHEPLAGGWQARRRQRPMFVWPLWSTPIDSDAVCALITHQDLAISVKGRSDPPAVELRRLRPLSVFLVCAAERQTISGRNFAGVLTPTALNLDRSDSVRDSQPTPA